jgi:tetratricopeptide (TPR) repeat protein
LNTWFSKADPKRLIGYDYLYQGRIALKGTKDTTAALAAYQKALQSDTTGGMSDLYGDIAGVYYAQHKYAQAGDAYQQYVTKSRKATLNDYFREGSAYYYAYAYALPKGNAAGQAMPDTMLITKGDSAFAHIQQKLVAANGQPFPAATLYRARLNDFKEKDRNNIVGYAKPFYEKYITELSAKTPLSDQEKRGLAEANVYLGNYAEYKDKDDAKATEYFTKAREYDPTNAQAKYFFDKKGAGAKGGAKGK